MEGGCSGRGAGVLIPNSLLFIYYIALVKVHFF